MTWSSTHIWAVEDLTHNLNGSKQITFLHILIGAFPPFTFMGAFPSLTRALYSLLCHFWVQSVYSLLSCFSLFFTHKQRLRWWDIPSSYLFSFFFFFFLFYFLLCFLMLTSTNGKQRMAFYFLVTRLGHVWHKKPLLVYPL